MRVLLDECLPRRLSLELVDHTVTSFPQAGWAGMKNGELLSLIGGQFEAFVTVDQNLAAQQNTSDLPFGVVVLRAPSNNLAELKPLVPRLLTTLAALRPGEVVVISSP